MLQLILAIVELIAHGVVASKPRRRKVGRRGIPCRIGRKRYSSIGDAQDSLRMRYNAARRAGDKVRWHKDRKGYRNISQSRTIAISRA